MIPNLVAPEETKQKNSNIPDLLAPDNIKEEPSDVWHQGIDEVRKQQQAHKSIESQKRETAKLKPLITEGVQELSNPSAVQQSLSGGTHEPLILKNSGQGKEFDVINPFNNSEAGKLIDATRTVESPVGDLGSMDQEFRKAYVQDEALAGEGSNQLKGIVGEIIDNQKSINRINDYNSINKESIDLYTKAKGDELSLPSGVPASELKNLENTYNKMASEGRILSSVQDNYYDWYFKKYPERRHSDYYYSLMEGGWKDMLTEKGYTEAQINNVRSLMDMAPGHENEKAKFIYDKSRSDYKDSPELIDETMYGWERNGLKVAESIAVAKQKKALYDLGIAYQESHPSVPGKEAEAGQTDPFAGLNLPEGAINSAMGPLGSAQSWLREYQDQFQEISASQSEALKYENRKNQLVSGSPENYKGEAAEVSEKLALAAEQYKSGIQEIQRIDPGGDIEKYYQQTEQDFARVEQDVKDAILLYPKYQEKLQKSEDRQLAIDEWYKDAMPWERIGQDVVNALGDAGGDLMSSISGLPRLLFRTMPGGSSKYEWYDSIADSVNDWTEGNKRSSSRSQQSLFNKYYEFKDNGKTYKILSDSAGKPLEVRDEKGYMIPSGDASQIMASFKNGGYTPNDMVESFESDLLAQKSFKTLVDAGTLLVMTGGSGALLKGAGALSRLQNAAKFKSALSGAIANTVYSHDKYFREAMDAGIGDPNLADQYAFSTSIVEGVIEQLNPLEKRFTPALKKTMLGDIVQAVKNGTDYQAAFKESFQKVAGDIIKENTEEFSQAMAGSIAKMYVNGQAGGVLMNPNISTQELAETFILTAITTGIISGSSTMKSLSSVQKDAIYSLSMMTDSDLQSAIGRATEAGTITEQQATRVLETAMQSKMLLNSMPMDLDKKQQKEILSLLVSKNNIQKKMEGADSSLKEVFNKEVKDIDGKILKVIDPSSVLESTESDIKQTENTLMDKRAELASGSSRGTVPNYIQKVFDSSGRILADDLENVVQAESFLAKEKVKLGIEKRKPASQRVMTDEQIADQEQAIYSQQASIDNRKLSTVSQDLFESMQDAISSPNPTAENMERSVSHMINHYEMLEKAKRSLGPKSITMASEFNQLQKNIEDRISSLKLKYESSELKSPLLDGLFVKNEESKLSNDFIAKREESTPDRITLERGFADTQYSPHQVVAESLGLIPDDNIPVGGSPFSGKIGDTSIVITDSASPRTITLESIETKGVKGNGSGKAALQSLVKEADDLGLDIELAIAPMKRDAKGEPTGTDKNNLQKFYEGFGFEMQPDGKTMIRKSETNPSREGDGSAPVGVRGANGEYIHGSINNMEQFQEALQNEMINHHAAKDLATLVDTVADVYARRNATSKSSYYQRIKQKTNEDGDPAGLEFTSKNEDQSPDFFQVDGAKSLSEENLTDSLSRDWVNILRDLSAQGNLDSIRDLKAAFKLAGIDFKEDITPEELASVQDSFSKGFGGYLKKGKVDGAIQQTMFSGFRKFLTSLFQKLTSDPSVDKPNIKKAYEALLNKGEETGMNDALASVKVNVKDIDTILQKRFNGKIDPNDDTLTMQAGFGGLIRQLTPWAIEDKLWTKRADTILDNIRRNLSTLSTSKNKIARGYANMMHYFDATSAKTSKERAQKNVMLGASKLSTIEAYKMVEDLRKLLDNNYDSMERIHQVLDPDVYHSGSESAPALNSSRRKGSPYGEEGSVPVKGDPDYRDYFKVNSGTGTSMVQDMYADLTDNEKAVYNTLRKTLNLIHDLNYVNGLIDDKTWMKYDGVYTPRTYKTYELSDDQLAAMGLKKPRITGSQLIDKAKGVIRHNNSIYKERKLDTDNTDQADYIYDNIIKDPIYGTALRFMETQQNIAVKNYADSLAANKKNYTDDKEDAQKRGMKLMPNERVYGDLKNKYVPRHIYEDFVGHQFYNGLADLTYMAFTKYSNTPLSRFIKRKNTSLNPAVTLTNYLSGVQMGIVNGVDPISYTVYTGKAIKQMVSGGKDYRLLQKAGVIGNHIDVGFEAMIKELKDVPDNQKMAALSRLMSKTAQPFKFIDKKASQLYTALDDVNKLATYMAKTEGYKMNHQDAVRDVMNGFQDYATVGKIWDFASKTPLIGNPYIKFMPDLMRIVKNSVIRRPLTTASWLAGWQFLKYAASEAFSDEDELDKKIRTVREGIKKYPPLLKALLGVMDMNIEDLDWLTDDASLTLRAPGDREADIGRLFAYNEYDMYGPESNVESISKYLPYQANINPNTGTPIPKLQDPLLAPIASVMADLDYRFKSIADPQKTRYDLEGRATDSERMWNQAMYLFDQYLPMGGQVRDIYLSSEYGEDRYGRRKDVLESALSVFLKVQIYGKSEVKRDVEKKTSEFTRNLKSLEDALDQTFSRENDDISRAEESFIKNGNPDTEKLGNKIRSISSEAEKKRKELDEKIKQLEIDQEKYYKENGVLIDRYGL